MPDELDQLFTKLQDNVQFPEPRSESRILSLLPPGTVAYVALPNYGNVVSQTLTIFRQQLQDRPVLREWWTHSQFTASRGPKFLAALDQFAQLHQYLGEEIVFSAAMDIQEPTFLFVSEVRRPGLKPALQQFAAQISGNPKSPMRVIDQIELATATERPHAEEPIILVRPDFVVVSLDLNTLRGFNAQLDARKSEFPATPFGRRVADEYKGGLTLLGAANVGKILEKTLPAVKQGAAFQQSGFADMQYLIWGHTFNAGKPVSQLELSFASPRHGAASWLAKPTALGSLDFVAPTPLFVTTVVLSDPAQIFDEAQSLAALSHSNTFAAVPTIEQASKLSPKDDLFSLLSGEVTVEIDKFAPPQTVWKVALAVKDPTSTPRITRRCSRKILPMQNALAMPGAPNSGTTSRSLQPASLQEIRRGCHASLKHHWHQKLLFHFRRPDSLQIRRSSSHVSHSRRVQILAATKVAEYY